MASSNVLVLGSINTDLVIRGPRLPGAGETVLGGTFYEAPGGKGANQAVAAARAASDRRSAITFVAAVGDDAYGQASRARLETEGIDCRFIKTAAGQATGIALILVDQAGNNLISVAPGANAHLLPEDIDAIPNDVFRQAAVFLVCLESPLPTVARALQRAKKVGALNILNPAPVMNEIMSRAVLQHVDVLTPNEVEAATLAGGLLGAQEELVSLAARFRELGCPQTVFTLGEQGCLVVGNEMVAIAAHQVTAVDSTAAGDAFNGALAVALSEGKSLPAAARWANRAAALSVTRAGAQPSLPWRAEIEELCESNGGDA